MICPLVRSCLFDSVVPRFLAYTSSRPARPECFLFVMFRGLLYVSIVYQRLLFLCIVTIWYDVGEVLTTKESNSILALVVQERVVTN